MKRPIQWSGFSTGSNTVDGVHPNDSGNRRCPTAGTRRSCVGRGSAADH
jgi:hypothetical protein